MDTSAVSLRLSSETLEADRPLPMRSPAQLQSQLHVQLQTPPFDPRLIRACNWLLDMLLDEDEDGDDVGDIDDDVSDPDAKSAKEDVVA